MHFKRCCIDTTNLFLEILNLFTKNKNDFFFNFRAHGDVYRLQSKLETSQSEADRLAMDLVTIRQLNKI
jgi:hypothetical protein